MTLGKMTDAIKAFTNSLKIDDTNSDAYANRAICFSYVDEKGKSLSDVKQAVKRGAVEAGLKQAIKLVEEKKIKEKKLSKIKKKTENNN
jgi:Tfp pilus assembly protein PilF